MKKETVNFIAACRSAQDDRHRYVVKRALLLSAIAVVLTVVLFMLPAFAQTEIIKDAPSACEADNIRLVKIVTQLRATCVQVEPAVIFHPVYIVKRKKVFQPINIFFALEILKPCETPKLIRSRKDAKCYRKSRLP